MKFIYLFVLCSFIFSSGACTFPRDASMDEVNYSRLTYYQPVFEKGGQGIVIMGMENNAVSSNFKVFYTHIEFRNEKNEKFYLASNDSKVYKNKNGNGGDYVIMLFPGKYTATQYKIFNSNSSMHSSMEMIERYSLSFEVKPNELLYAGYIVSDMKNPERGNKKWYQSKFHDSDIQEVSTVEDRSAQSKKLLDMYQKLTNKEVQIRLMTIKNNVSILNQVAKTTGNSQEGGKNESK